MLIKNARLVDANGRAAGRPAHRGRAHPPPSARAFASARARRWWTPPASPCCPRSSICTAISARRASSTRRTSPPEAARPRAAATRSSTAWRNTKPVCSSADIARSVMAQAEEVGLCGVKPVRGPSRRISDGQTLDHLRTLPEDIRFLSDDGRGVRSSKVMYDAMVIAAERGLVIMSHAEDMDLSPIDYRLAENLETARNLYIAQSTGARLHMCHVSTKEAMEDILAARRRGVRVTCEVTPHHIWFLEQRLPREPAHPRKGGRRVPHRVHEARRGGRHRHRPRAAFRPRTRPPARRAWWGWRRPSACATQSCAASTAWRWRSCRA